MVEICVINLDRATDRWAHIAAQSEALSLPVTRIPAVDGRRSAHPLFRKYNETLSLKWKGSTLSAGQLGCFASHYLVWQRCVEMNKPLIVMEDDAVVNPEGLSRFLSVLDSLPPYVECIRLFRNHSKNFRVLTVRRLPTGLDLVKYTKGPMRGTAYYLTPQAAKKFIAASERWFLPVDITMDRFWANGVECFGLMPAIVHNAPEFDSTIGYEPREYRRPLIVRCRRELFALREQFFKAMSNLQFWVRLRLLKRY